MITLNNKKHDVSQGLVDAMTARLHARLLKLKNETRADVDARSVVGEIARLYPSVVKKDWYRDYVIQFCNTRGIPIHVESL